MSFADLKKQSSLGSLTSKLVKEVEKMSATSGGADERLWKPELDKTGNGFAVIRFLPAPEGEDVPWSKVYSHGFQGPGGWYIENSLTTIGQKDPVSEYNRQLWNSGTEANKEIVRKQKRKLSYYSNIYVVKDPSNPANEGKVFLFKYGKKIFDKINEAMHPQFQDEKAVNPFDFWDGANFKLKIRQVEGYRNYDKSEFDSSSPVADSDEAIKKIWESQYSLQELLDLKHFKTYDELKMRLEKALGNVDTSSRQSHSVDEDEAFPTPYKTAPAPSIAKQESNPWDDDDEDLSFFKKLASD